MEFDDLYYFNFFFGVSSAPVLARELGLSSMFFYYISLDVSFFSLGKGPTY
jgi:hypothetical protein